MKSFISAFVGCLAAILLVRAIDRGVWVPLVVAAVVIPTAGLFKYWYDGYRGLNQWPSPHGKYYNQWMEMPEGAGDYFDWLSKQKGDREPWSTWAKLERSSR